MVGLLGLSAAACDAPDESIDPGPGPQLDREGPPPPNPEPPPEPPGSLRDEPLPPIFDRITGKPVTGDLIADNDKAVLLGKALFWDMQAGSDGQACASCHFVAGADSRARNQLSPGLLGGNGVFDDTRTGQLGANVQLVAGDYPFHVKQDPDDRESEVLFDTDDVTSSQGVVDTAFKAVVPGALADTCKTVADPTFNVDDIDVRRVEPRNAPTVINAAFNFRNFWDGRANRVFNGVDPFGRRDKKAFILEVHGDEIVKRKVELVNSSLASQAVGPLISDFETSCAGRRFPDVARKLLRDPARPLAFQKVHPQDSVLGPYAEGAGAGLQPGITYATLIQEAFAPKLWDSDAWFDGARHRLDHPNKVPLDQRFTLMEANFSLIWGLAIQAYERTLVSADSPFDKLRDGRDAAALDAAALRGFDIFMDQGKCINCHGTAMFTNASSIHLIPEDQEGGLVERMLMSEEHFHYGVKTNEPIELSGIGWKPGKPGPRDLTFDVEATPSLAGDKIVPGAAVGSIVLTDPKTDKACRYTPLTLTFGADGTKSRDAEIEATLDTGDDCPPHLRVALHDDLKLIGDTWLDAVFVEDKKGELLHVSVVPAKRAEIRQPALYDNGFYNIGVRPSLEDPGVGGVDPFGHPLSFTAQYVDKLLGEGAPDLFKVDPCSFEIPWAVALDGPLFPGGFSDKTHCGGVFPFLVGRPSNNKTNRHHLENLRTAVRGAFKTPTLRNVQLTAPYMHSGGMATLEQVVEFYNRGGNFPRNRELDPDITPLGLSADQRADLVRFLEALTDPNVVDERAPFDHPELFVPDGLASVVDNDHDGRADENLFVVGLHVPAVGKQGRAAAGQPQIETFLDLEPSLPTP
jgi:cytochrome c peroxidase